MKKYGLILIGAASLLACASDPPFAPSPTPTPAVAATPEPEAEPAAPAPDRSGQTAEGQWCVSLISVRTVEKAAQLSRQIESQGYFVETEVVEVDGTTWQRLVLPGYSSEEEARAMLPVVEQELGVEGAWVLPRRKAEP